MSLLIGGASKTITATVSPSNGTNKNVSWTSSNENIATVKNGLVTPVTTGSAIITVSTQDGNKLASCEVTVTDEPITSVTSLAEELALELNHIQKL